MKIEVNRKELIQVLKRLSAVVPKQTTLPILHSALVEANSIGIRFHATDLDQWVSVNVPGKVEKKGKGLFPVKKLEKAVKAFTADKVSITLTGDGKIETCRVLLQCGKTKFKMDTRSLDDYPKIPKLKPVFGFEIKPALLISMLKKTVYAVCSDLTRPTLCGVLFKVERKKLILIATDGHRLSLVRNMSGSVNFKKTKDDIIVRDSSLKLLKSYADLKGSLRVNVGEKWVQFSCYEKDRKGTMQITSKLCEGPFPNYEKVIPQNTEQSLKVSREDFLKAVKRISVFSDPETRALLLEVEKTKMTLSAHSDNTGTASEDIKCTGNGSFKVGYNATYLEQALKTLEGGEVKLSMEDDCHGGLIEEKTEDLDHMIILMPIRI